MKKYVTSALLLTMVLILTGCNSSGFSKLSPYENLNSASDVTVSIGETDVENKRLTLIITNNTANEYTYDMVYYIEQNRNDKWYGMDGEMYFPAIAAVLEPNGENSFIVSWENTLRDGSYRVIKPVYAGGEKCCFSAEFTIGEKSAE